MATFKQLFNLHKFQVSQSKLQKLNQSKHWEKISDTEAENIQGGWGWAKMDNT